MHRSDPPSPTVTIMKRRVLISNEKATRASALPSRRDFLKVAVCGAAGLGGVPLLAAQAVQTLPTVPIGPYRVTRLISGFNPQFGYSHATPLLNQFMLDYFTDQQVVKYLLACEKAGINTWQSNYRASPQRQIPLVREAGCKMNWICLADQWRGSGNENGSLDEIEATKKCAWHAMKLNPVGIAYHGMLVDQRWAAGTLDPVKRFIDYVHDLGCPAGISTHIPAVIEYVESKNWAVDFYMACFYRVSRSPQDFVKDIGVEPVGEAYLASDPERMTKVIRQAGRTCLAFKILAAGRKCQSPEEVRGAFQYAFKNIKPTDATIVGMVPKFSDQITENVRIVSEITAQDALAQGK